MSRQVKTIQRNTPLSQVVALLWREGVKAEPVTENEHRVIGIITGGDLVARGGMDLRLSLQKALNPEELSPTRPIRTIGQSCQRCDDDTGGDNSRDHLAHRGDECHGDEAYQTSARCK